MSRREEFAGGSDQYRIVYDDSDPSEHAVRAFHPDKEDDVGEFCWRRDTGEIANVAVDIEHQRRGLATSLLQHARRVAARNGYPAPKHSSHQTDDGAAWAKAVGD